MWKEYKLPGHCRHFRYEVEGKWYIGYIPAKEYNEFYSCFREDGRDIKEDGLPDQYGYFYTPYNVLTECNHDDEKIMHWLLTL